MAFAIARFMAGFFRSRAALVAENETTSATTRRLRSPGCKENACGSRGGSGRCYVIRPKRQRLAIAVLVAIGTPSVTYLVL
jgi:hypothetical protein